MDKEGRLISQLTTGKLLFVAVVILLTWLLLKWMRGLFGRLEIGNPRLRFLARQVEPPMRIALWFLSFLLCTDVLAPSKDAFLAALGSAALAIGLGVQDLIKNLIGGLVIVADRPYQTGDLVRMGDAYGEVAQIGLRSTKILTVSGVLVTVPNSEIMNRFTYNANAGVPECMVTAILGVPHGADPDLLLRVGREIAISSLYTHLAHQVEAELDERGLSSHTMSLMIRGYVYDHRYESRMQTDLLRRAKREFLALGILKPHEVSHDYLSSH
jgi:small-conductance mechanosensitive channel